jgi:hypothetical protein
VSLIDDTRTALAHAAQLYTGTSAAPRLKALRERLDDPLRVAIAGRIKSGKSTLLNALVGERLAPTNAGECTKIVTWYQDGHTYRVDVYPRGRSARQARFTRDDGVLEIDLGVDNPDDVDQLVVRAFAGSAYCHTDRYSGIGSPLECFAPHLGSSHRRG